MRAPFVTLLVLGLATPRAALAQDMVFTPEETQDAPVAAGIDAPPSEVLANALRRYGGERYDEAAVQLQRVVQGETADSPANVEKAQFFLAKSLTHLGYSRAALGVLDEITERPTHHYFAPALPWLAQLATQLPEPAGVVELVGRFAPAHLAALERPETADVHAHLLYLSGRHAYAEGDLEAAIERLARVPDGSPHCAKARFFEGVSHVRRRRARPAIAAFRAVLDQVDRHGDRVPEHARMRDLAWLSLARVYYSAANRTDERGDRVVDGALLSNAVAAWDRIDPASEHWLDALLEQSWALFLADETSRAMGNLHGLLSPYFEGADYPEALVLKAVVFFGACQIDNAQAMIRQFHERYDPVRAELARTLARFDAEAAREGDGDRSRAVFALLRATREGDAALAEETRGVIAGALSDRTILRHLEYVRVLDREEQRLDAAAPAFRGSSLGDRIRAEVLVSRSFAVDRAAELARGRLARLVDDLDGLMSQMDTVELEGYRVLREGLSREEASERERIAASRGGDVEVDEEHQIWRFDGEYWRDELPYYRQQVSSICSR